MEKVIPGLTPIRSLFNRLEVVSIQLPDFRQYKPEAQARKPQPLGIRKGFVLPSMAYPTVGGGRLSAHLKGRMFTAMA